MKKLELKKRKAEKLDQKYQELEIEKALNNIPQLQQKMKSLISGFQHQQETGIAFSFAIFNPPEDISPSLFRLEDVGKQAQELSSLLVSTLDGYYSMFV